MRLSTIVTGSAAAVLLLTASAFAQRPPAPYQQQQQQQPQQQQQWQQGQHQRGHVSKREARQFMSGIERDVTQMVQSGDLSHLREWTQDHVADHAVLSRTNTIATEANSRVVSSATITKPDLMRLQRFVLSGISDKLNAVEDYGLNIQVMNVEPVGDSAAIVKSRITERATIGAPRAGRLGQQQQQGQQPRDFTTGQGPRQDLDEDDDDGQQQPAGRSPGSVQMELHAICTHLLERNKEGKLQVGMGVCDATTEAQL